jgi:hypothetical protein
VIVARMISCRFSSRAVLAPKSLRRMLQISEGITANEAVENWEPEFDTEMAFA